jgi:hypothetical protein
MDQPTPDLAKRLAAEIKPERGAPRPARFLAGWFAGTLLLTAFSLASMRLRPNLAEAACATNFWLESSLWLAGALVSANVMYRQSIPGLSSRRAEKLAYGVLGLLLLAIVCRGGDFSFGHQLDWYVGRCGPIIFGLGLLYSFALMGWQVRRGAPTRPARGGLWAALSAGLTGSLILQLICEHASPAHLLLWHVSPILLLGAFGAWLGRKLLSW